MIMLHTQVVTVSVTVRVVPNSKQKKSITKPFKLTTLPPSCTRQHILTSPIKTGEMYGILSVESSRGVGTVIVHVVVDVGRELLEQHDINSKEEISSTCIQDFNNGMSNALRANSERVEEHS